MKDAAKNGGVGGGREDFALRGSAGGSTGPARLEHVDDVAFPDPAFYIKCPDREAENVSR